MPFDLNIKNYSKDELLEMLGLSPGFNKEEFESKETQLRDSIIGNFQLDKETQEKTIQFIKQIRNVLFDGQVKSDISEFIAPYSTGLKTQIAEVFNSTYELKPIQTDSSHLVQHRPDTSYSASYPSDYFKGIVNPLKKKTIKKQLNIDTRFRENYFGSQSSDFNVSLPVAFNDVLAMTLNAIEVPTSYFVISKQMGNNFFHISVDGASQIVEIPSGNYKVDGFVAAINGALTLLGAPFDDVIASVNLTVTPGGANGSGQMLFQFTPTSTHTSLELDFQCDKTGNDDRFTPLPLKMGWLMGFRQGNYVNNLVYVSEGLVDLNGPRYLYLVVDDRNNNVNNSFYSAFNSSILNKNILARISVQVAAFSVISENNLNVVTLQRDYFGPVNIQNLTVQLLDEYGRIIDLNNMDYSFCLTFTTAYDL
jgi:hypothetical protein